MSVALSRNHIVFSVQRCLAKEETSQLTSQDSWYVRNQFSERYHRETYRGRMPGLYHLATEEPPDESQHKSCYNQLIPACGSSKKNYYPVLLNL